MPREFYYIRKKNIKYKNMFKKNHILKFNMFFLIIEPWILN